LFYLADQARAPYGVRTLAEVAEMTEEASRWLIDRGATTITIACNTASAAALHALRASHPDVPFVGMEPAVKPAVVSSATGVIGVLATAATFQGELFASVLQRHATGATVLTRACPKWVGLVEKAEVAGSEARRQVAACLAPMMDAGADTLVLGCTHFPFLIPLIQAVAGPDVRIVDPAPAVARQVRRVASGVGGSGRLTLATSGEPERFLEVARVLAGIEAVEPVLACNWNDG
ncbi:MAG: glutamate racemase, partial [Acidimicrobiia bacterium]